MRFRIFLTDDEIHSNQSEITAKSMSLYSLGFPCAYEPNNMTPLIGISCLSLTMKPFIISFILSSDKAIYRFP